MHVPELCSATERRRATTTVYPTTATLMDDGGDGRTVDAGHARSRAHGRGPDRAADGGGGLQSDHRRRQRRPARHRRHLRRPADDAQPRRPRHGPGARDDRAVRRRPRRPLRPGAPAVHRTYGSADRRHRGKPRPDDRVPHGRARAHRHRCGLRVSDDARPDHRPLGGGPGTRARNRPVDGHRGGGDGRRLGDLGGARRRVRLAHRPAAARTGRRRGAAHRRTVDSAGRGGVRRTGRSSRRHPVGHRRGRAGARSRRRLRPGGDGCGGGPARRRGGADRRLRGAPAADRGAPLRSVHRAAAPVLGPGRRRHPRLRRARGGDVRRAAVPAEHPRLRRAAGGRRPSRPRSRCSCARRWRRSSSNAARGWR